MRRVPSHKRAAQTGMTLVEVMMAMVLTAILLVGMNALWVEITREVDGLVLRQKAIFRLNGEMERLTGLYAVSSPTIDPAAPPSSPGWGVHAVDDYGISAPSNRGDYIGTTPDVDGTTGLWTGDPRGERLIYAQNSSGGPAFMADADPDGADTAFARPLSQGSALFGAANDGANAVFSRVLYWDASGTGATNRARNLVWLDRTKSIVGQISWSSVRLTGVPLSNYRCYYGDPCRHITLYLDFPYRYVDAANPREEIDGEPVNTITLQTIVSRRR